MVFPPDFGDLRIVVGSCLQKDPCQLFHVQLDGVRGTRTVTRDAAPTKPCAAGTIEGGGDVRPEVHSEVDGPFHCHHALSRALNLKWNAE